MAVYRIPKDELLFPHPSLAEPSGLLGVGGDLTVDRLLLAYRNGIFPWYAEDQPILWFSPNPRCVLDPRDLRIGRSLGKTLRKGRYRVTLDVDFPSVIDGCKHTPRPGQDDTWITEDMRSAYIDLHHAGYAHSVEVWLDEELVGGLYGVAIGQLFAGESMFSRASDASKTGLIWLVRQLAIWGFTLVDAQVRTDTLARLGAVEIDREQYLDQLAVATAAPERMGPWSFDSGFSPV
ncbi:MAG: leucyl/phenylalanyl-tRNA--protein transferase [Deltaproteobacteria bacterium]|nr:leucyl/phenylalanyl-tRNA--protein transferase [Deltaproteobacteria bacterium]